MHALTFSPVSLSTRAPLAALLLSLLLTALLLAAPDAGAANPFTGGGAAQTNREETPTPPAAAPALETGSDMNPYQSLLRLSAQWQREIRSRLGGFARDICVRPLGPSLWLFLGLSFLYGVAHAIGPGHGKAVLCSYFLSRPGSMLRGMLMANAIALVHVCSAILVVSLAFWLLRTGMRGFDDVAAKVELASYGLLVLVGLWLLWRAVRTLRGGDLPHCCHHDQEPDSLRQALLLSLATGLIPCPGAAIILTFTMTLGIAWAGFLAMIAVGLGMGTTTTAFAIGTIAARGTALRLMDADGKALRISIGLLSLLGAASILAFGVIMLLGATA